MKDIIKQIEEERNRLESQVIKLNRIIGELKAMESGEANIPEEMATPGYPEPIEATRKKRGIPRKENVTRPKKEARKRGRRQSYTPEVESFIREAVKTKKLAEICEELKEKFGMEINPGNLSKWNWVHGIKAKVREYGHRPRGNNKKHANESRKGRKPSIFTKEVLEFMRECSKTMTRKQAIGQTEVKFGYPFSILSFAQTASDNKIRFANKQDISVQCDRETFEMIKKHRKLKAEEIRDKIIDKTGININIGTIKSILRRLETNSDIEARKELDKEESQGNDESAEAIEEFVGEEEIE